MSDTTAPSISTNIRITNEGTTAYEYQYTWCITDSEINVCGGGNDIFNSTAAKLIQPGENFDTVLNSTIATAGNYWFHLDVQFGSDSSQAIQSFTATEGAVVTPPSSVVTPPSSAGASSSTFIPTPVVTPPLSAEEVVKT